MSKSVAALNSGNSWTKHGPQPCICVALCSSGHPNPDGTSTTVVIKVS